MKSREASNELFIRETRKVKVFFYKMFLKTFLK